MKTRNIFAFAVSLLAILAWGAIDSKPLIGAAEKGDGFVVLELFTSEGCSSCPKADELLGKVQQQAGGKPIFILAYHIDYWDHQGWRDIFSNASYTKRQYWYADKLNAQVYTPQVVVNGKKEFVGSDQAALTKALSNSLDSKPTNILTLTGKIQAGKLDVTYQLSGAKAGQELVIAAVQKHAVRQIKRGENEGRVLNHVQIVRSLHSFKLGKSNNGQIVISLPKEFTESGWEVIGLLQNKETGEIYAAGKVSV